jgi:predicted nucleotidyltransferase
MDKLPAAIADHLDEIRALCVTYHVKRLAVFGSAVKGTFDPAKSDVDFVVEFFSHSDAIAAGGNTLEFLSALEQLLGRPVDLLNRAYVRNPYLREEVDETQRELYAA